MNHLMSALKVIDFMGKVPESYEVNGETVTVFLEDDVAFITLFNISHECKVFIQNNYRTVLNGEPEDIIKEFNYILRSTSV